MDQQQLLNAYPEINLVQDKSLRKLVTDSFLLGIQLGDWDNKGGIENCPVAAEGLLCDDCDVTGLVHMRSVADATSRIISCLEPWMNVLGYTLDRDFCLSSALLHDVGKLIEFDRDGDGIPRYSKVGKMFCHTSAGAYIVKKAGGDDAVVHAVLTHSHNEAPEGHKAYENPELIIVKGCDLASYESILVAWSRPGAKVVI